MEWINENIWTLILACLGIFIVTTIIMGRIAQAFITEAPERKKFSIFRLEFPGSDAQLTKLVLQLGSSSKKAVRAHLLVDYIFMMGVYPGIALLCYKTFLVLNETQPVAAYIILAMGGLQIIAFACDVIENIMLLRKLSNVNSWNNQSHQTFSKLVFYKFTIALFALASTFCSWMYMWFSNMIPKPFVNGVAIAVAVLILYIMVKALINRRKRRIKERRDVTLVAQAINPN